MPAEHERLEGKHQCLQTENQRVHQAEGIDRMKHYGSEGAGVLRDDDVVIVGICIGDAAAAWCHTIKTAFEKGLEIDKQRAGFRHLLQIDQLLSAAELAGSDKVLNIRDDHWNYCERF